MTSRELLLEAVNAANSAYTHLFVLTFSMEDTTPVIQGFYEGRVVDGELAPPSYVIGASVLSQVGRLSKEKEHDDDEKEKGGVRH